MDEIIKLVCGDNIKYVTVSHGEYSYIVLYMPYIPYDYSYVDLSVGEFDSYFSAYQIIRNKRLELMELLLQSGYSADDRVDISYKQLAAQTGRAVILKNTLASFDEYGTFVVMEVVRVKGNYGGLPCDVKSNRLCDVCNLCENACPGHSISKKGFCRSTCLRDVQLNSLGQNQELMRAMGRKIIGCNVCQQVCPMNKNVLYSQPGKEERELFNVHNLFYAAASGKKALEPYEFFLGKNYLRPARLLVMAINAMQNTGDFWLKDRVEELSCHQDERVRQACRRYLEASVRPKEKNNETEKI